MPEDGSRAVYGWQRSEGRLRRLVEGLTLASVTLHLVRLGRTGQKDNARAPAAAVLRPQHATSAATAKKIAASRLSRAEARLRLLNPDRARDADVAPLEESL